MSEDNYGEDQRMSDEFQDNDDSQNISGDYEDSENKQNEDQDNPDKQSDDEQKQNDNDGDDLESVQSNQQQNRYEVIQEDQVVYDKPNTQRITSPFMTKYEKARIIGVRAVQISKNSPLYLTADSNSLMNWDPLTIAEKQLSEKKIPFIIRRYLPDGSFEDWKISELKTFD